jgi:pimeloyl-ACP methyl ester carboxylesterase
MNYVVSGSATSPALLLLPGQTESWWEFEKAIALLSKDFQVHAVDLRGQAKVPVLFTHHGPAIDPVTGQLAGAISDLQATKVREIVTAAGQAIEYVSLPDAAHAMHDADPARFGQVLTTWAKNLPA